MDTACSLLVIRTRVPKEAARRLSPRGVRILMALVFRIARHWKRWSSWLTPGMVLFSVSSEEINTRIVVDS